MPFLRFLRDHAQRHARRPVKHLYTNDVAAHDLEARDVVRPLLGDEDPRLEPTQTLDFQSGHLICEHQAGHF